MKIYTGFGDRGETSLWGGEKVSKNNLQVIAYGSLDELNSLVGLMRSYPLLPEIDTQLEQRQNEIFNLSSEIAASGMQSAEKLAHPVRLEQVRTLEQEMDKWTAELPELKNFILPGGTRVAALGHLARTVCRRAEREIVAFGSQKDLSESIYIYVNRLSDWFFTLARYINYKQGIKDSMWENERK